MLDTIGEEVGTAFDQGFRAARITTDYSWLLHGSGASDIGRMLGCENRVGDTVSPSTMAMAVCQIDRRACPPDQLAALRDTRGARGSEPRIRRRDPEDSAHVRVSRAADRGELDAARHTVFAEKLAQVVAQRGSVHLDVSRLGFIDLGGLNLLARHATRLPADGSLVLDNLRPNVESLISTVGWHRLPGLARGAGRGLPETEDFA